MGSFFDFDTPEKKRKGLAWAFALWLFCNTNVGLLPLISFTSGPVFSFSNEMLSAANSCAAYRNGCAVFYLAWIVIICIIAMCFFKTSGKRSKFFYTLLLIFVSILNIIHPLLLDIFIAYLAISNHL